MAPILIHFVVSMQSERFTGIQQEHFSLNLCVDRIKTNNDVDQEQSPLYWGILNVQHLDNYSELFIVISYKPRIITLAIPFFSLFIRHLEPQLLSS